MKRKYNRPKIKVAVMYMKDNCLQQPSLYNGGQGSEDDDAGTNCDYGWFDDEEEY